jgi:hypothetical protein
MVQRLDSEYQDIFTKSLVRIELDLINLADLSTKM